MKSILLVVVDLSKQEFLHQYHVKMTVGHQGIWRTYHNIRSNFCCLALRRCVQRFVNKCMDNETSKGCPLKHGGLPVNMRATSTFSKQFHGSHFLAATFIKQKHIAAILGIFSRYVFAKSTLFRTALAKVESYKDYVSASQCDQGIYHDREPRSMSWFSSIYID